MKVLIVEDEHEKRRLISEAVNSAAGMIYSNIDYAHDLGAAKRHLQANKYQLVILDINIPKNSISEPALGLGLELLDFIKFNIKAIKPTYVIGMSAYSDGVRAAASEFNFPLWRFIDFSYNQLDWQKTIKDAVEYLNENNKPPFTADGRNFHTDLCVYVALEEELVSLKNLSVEWCEIKVAHDDARYYQGQFIRGNKTLDVVIAASPEMGMPIAAVFAAKLIHTFRPKYLGIAGICAGVHSKSKMGDVLVADPCFDLGSGKWTVDKETEELKFLPALYQRRLDDTLRAKIRSLGDNKEALQDIWKGFHYAKPKEHPSVVIGAMGSGSSVLQALEMMEQAKERHKNLIGIEMESYSVFTACEFSSAPKPRCFSMKAVCDFGDSKKADDYHDYAAYVSANFLYEFALEHLDSRHEPA
ncbi:response regulator [Pseudomonas viridiflava]|uniref:phosphorylase family protein n=1 Tax=Pseudomonas viridiflava TaxID=33069 RepID=UPI000F015AE3|nr:response regulator [Pseudomonas viridiflava]